ncbi:MAG: hypothetical protein LBF86_01445 [Helicobacteraceae bacterium]|jgi:hypothetical protein|nr:hypothetical protein [Helicobacteraceae bacterium]
MTINEAALKALGNLQKPANSSEIFNHIVERKYYDFTAPTPKNTLSALLGNFIRRGDARVGRVLQENGVYLYYLTKDEQTIDFENINSDNSGALSDNKVKQKTFHERDLHILLSSYLNTIAIRAKTIYHEQSINKGKNQIWTHPDMVGVKFKKFNTEESRNLLEATNRRDALKFYSYEIKKSISNDSELKEAFFQAVSNSSWANYGFLAALEIGDQLKDEIERLSQAFGIGVIKLCSYPYESKILFQSKYRELDFQTIDKLCGNKSFKEFIKQARVIITSNDEYRKDVEIGLDKMCDTYFNSDSDIKKYCETNNIPFDKMFADII